jgi:hypothetical protein
MGRVLSVREEIHRPGMLDSSHAERRWEDLEPSGSRKSGRIGHHVLGPGGFTDAFPHSSTPLPRQGQNVLCDESDRLWNQIRLIFAMVESRKIVP